jgi:DNA-binding LytR/AlgR family response regulator
VPIVFIITYNEAVHNKKYKALSDDINTHRITKNNVTKQITLTSINENEDLRIGADDLVYITSADNYIEIYYNSSDQLKKKLLRNTLKNTEAIFIDFQNIIRCHKSYIVNLNYVVNVTGNAQGYKLHLENNDLLIPVSRKLDDFVKEKLTS